jgi:hypothetical protein
MNEQLWIFFFQIWWLVLRYARICNEWNHFSEVKTGYRFMISPQDVTEYIHVFYSRSMDKAKVKPDSDMETNQRSCHNEFHFIGIKQEEEVDSEDEVSLFLRCATVKHR